MNQTEHDKFNYNWLCVGIDIHLHVRQVPWNFSYLWMLTLRKGQSTDRGNNEFACNERQAGLRKQVSYLEQTSQT